MVYDDAEILYAEVAKDGKKLIEDAFNSIFGPKTLPISFSAPLGTTSPGEIVAFNSTFFPRLEVVPVPLQGSGGSRLRPQVLQSSKDGKIGYALMDCRDGASLAYAEDSLAGFQSATSAFICMSLFAI